MADQEKKKVDAQANYQKMTTVHANKAREEAEALKQKKAAEEEYNRLV